MNLAPADLVHRILRDQRLLLDRDPALRIRFEVAARNRPGAAEQVCRGLSPGNAGERQGSAGASPG
ncbi:MAG: hypothetical protein ABI895_27115 [Deltaproteobacteria bacterium]